MAQTFTSSLQKQQIDMVEKNKKLQKKLEEILPESIKEEGMPILLLIETPMLSNCRYSRIIWVIKKCV